MRRTPLYTTLLHTILAAALLALVAACGEVGPEPTVLDGDAEDDRAALTERCENPRDGYAIGYPEDWHANGSDDGIIGCRAFDPEPLDLEPHTAIALETGVIVSAITATTADEIANDGDPTIDVREQRSTEAGGHDAIVVEATGTGDGPIPEGTRIHSYYVDLDEVTVVAFSTELGEPDFDTKRVVLTEMVETLEPIDPGH